MSDDPNNNNNPNGPDQNGMVWNGSEWVRPAAAPDAGGDQPANNDDNQGGGDQPANNDDNQGGGDGA